MSGNNGVWNRPRGGAEGGVSGTKKVPSKWKGIAAGLAIVVPLLVILAWVFTGGEPEPEVKSVKRPSLVKEVKPAPAPKSVQAANPEKPKVEKKKIPPKPDFMDKVPYSEMTPEQRAIRADYYAYKAKSIDFDNPAVDRRGEKANLIVDDPVQIEFLKYFEPGSFQPPTGRISDQAAINAIVSGVKINEDDPPEVAEKKGEIQAMLDDLKEYMKQGGKAQEYFKALDHRQELESSTMDEVRKNVNQLMREGDDELAAAAIRKYNTYLKGKGLPELRNVRYRKILEAHPEKKTEE